MPNIFVLTLEHDYEGEAPIGVFSTLDRAWARMTTEAKRRGWDDWEAGPARTGELRPAGHCSGFIIRESAIDPPNE